MIAASRLASAGMGWRRRGSIVTLLATLMNGGAQSAPSKTDTSLKTHTVTIENMRFNPVQLIVHRGDRIVWVNKDLFPHTATASSKAFDSGSIAANASWSFVARKAGDYAYGCSFHPTMTGRLVVQ